jgi:hypothetical protein
MKKIIIVLVIVLLTMFMGCKSNDSVNNEPELPRANISLSNFTAHGVRNELDTLRTANIAHPNGNSNAGDYYVINLQLAETGGVTATITSIQFTFISDETTLGTYTPTVTEVFPNTQIGANGILDMDQILVSTGDTQDYCTAIQVAIEYRDNNNYTGATNGSVQTPEYRDADIILKDNTIYIGYSLGYPGAQGTLENVGTRAARDATIRLRVYDANDNLVDTGVAVISNQIAVDATVDFEAMFFVKFDWDDIGYFEWETQWHTENAGGQTQTKSGRVYLKHW